MTERVVVAVAVMVLGSTSAIACKKPTPIAAPPDAGVADASNVTADPASKSADADAGRKFRLGALGLDAGAARPPPRPSGSPSGASSPSSPPLPLASDSLELVAIGKTFNSRVLWMQEIGSRVWLSALNLDAFADGDGPLKKGPDILEKLPYKPGVHSMHVVGAYPRLFALRTKNVNGRMESPEPTVFVYTAEESGPGTWKEAKPLGMSWYPHAFVAFREGALVVTGQIELNGGPFFSPPGPGTTFFYVAPDGTVSDPKLDVHPYFMAWDASSDRDTLALIGTMAVPPKKKDDSFEASGIHVVRVTKDGAKTVTVSRSPIQGMEAYASRVHEHGGRASVVPPASTTAEMLGWTGTRIVRLLDAENKVQQRTVAGSESCVVVDAQHAGDVVYAIRRCYETDFTEQLVRVDASGKTARLAMPRIVKKEGGGFRVATTDKEKAGGFACVPHSMVVREPDDLWIHAKCGGNGSWDNSSAVPIVLRRGRPQETIVIP